LLRTDARMELMMPGMEGRRGLSMQVLGTTQRDPDVELDNKFNKATQLTYLPPFDDVGVLRHIPGPIVQVVSKLRGPTFPIVRFQKALAVAVILRQQNPHAFTIPIKWGGRQFQRLRLSRTDSACRVFTGYHVKDTKPCYLI
jgi:hypothetical protein